MSSSTDGHDSFNSKHVPLFDDFSKTWDQYANDVLPGESVFHRPTRLYLIQCEAAKGKAVKQEDIDTPVNAEGIPLFPRFDHLDFSVKKIASIIEVYLTSLWGVFLLLSFIIYLLIPDTACSSEAKGKDSGIPWEDLRATPEKFFDVSRHKDLRLLGRPGNLSRDDTYALAACLTEISTDSPGDPFVFTTEMVPGGSGLTSEGGRDSQALGGYLCK